jgi:hypothetical protein
MIGRAANFSGYRPKFYRYWSKNLGFRQVLTEICPKKFFLTSGVRKKFFYPYFLNVRKKFFNPLNGTLTKNFLATEGGGRSTKHFPAGRLRLSQGNHSRHPPPPPPPLLKGASFAPASTKHQRSSPVLQIPQRYRYR